MKLYSCPRCQAKFSTDADDIASHLSLKHQWSLRDAANWMILLIERDYK